MCIFPVYSYTFTRSSDSLNLHIQICGYLLLIRYLERITCVTRRWSLSFLDYRYSCSFIHVISWFYLYRIQLSFSFLYSSVIIMLDILYVILQWYWFIVVDFVACSAYFRLSVYAWGIFLAYIRHRPSSRLRFSVFWEAGRDRVFVFCHAPHPKIRGNRVATKVGDVYTRGKYPTHIR